jgi:myo-inositol-1(or 4)-monophosphatase
VLSRSSATRHLRDAAGTSDAATLGAMKVLSSAPPPVDPALLSRALDVAGRLANDAAEVITATAGRGTDVHAGLFDWVTSTDRTLARHTRRILAAEFAGVPVVGEEWADDAPAEHRGKATVAFGDPGGTPYRWLVGGPGESRCGSANYVAGFGWCAYSLALVDAAGPVVGVVADPGRAQIYAAARGRGTRANGVAVPSGTRGPAGGPVCCELGGDGAAAFLRAAGTRARVLGSAALAIMQVALGHAGAAAVDGHRAWDVAGALCLAAESGAVVVDALGRPDPLPAGALLVARPAAVETVLEWWRLATAT